jgi:hypothetical protein
VFRHCGSFLFLDNLRRMFKLSHLAAENERDR